MLYLALLPLLAISGTLAGPMRRGRIQKWGDKTDTNRQLFLDPTTGEKDLNEVRYAKAYDRRSTSPS